MMSTDYWFVPSRKYYALKEWMLLGSYISFNTTSFAVINNNNNNNNLHALHSMLLHLRFIKKKKIIKINYAIFFLSSEST